MNRDLQSLLDIARSAEMALGYVEGMSESDFYGNEQLQDAVIRRLLVVGEAANRVSEDMRQKLPNIPWAEIRGIRNRLVHEYDEVDLVIVWKTVQEDMAVLISKIKAVMPPDNQLSMFE